MRLELFVIFFFFFSSRRRHTRLQGDWSSDCALPIYGHLPLLVAVSVVLPTEGDRLAIEGEEPVIGDGHTMGISGQVLQQVIGTAEGCFGVDDPLFLAH